MRWVSVTNDDAGHQSEGGGALAKRRRAEAQEGGRRLGIEYVVLDNHDGQLMPTLEVREQVIRQMRQWNADLVLGPRPQDYHPDHPYVGILLQDARLLAKWKPEIYDNIFINIVKEKFLPERHNQQYYIYQEDTHFGQKLKEAISATNSDDPLAI